MASALLAACGGRTRSAPAPRPAVTEVDYTSIDSPSLQFLPRHEEVPGWRLEEDPIVVPGERIGSYLGPAAQSFIHYDLIDLTAGKYSATTGNGFATVEIFRFPDFVKAFGAYSVRKGGNIEFIGLENEAFLSRVAVHLWRGPFYVRITGSTPAGSKGLQSLAAAVAERMPPAPAKPAVFNFFPTDSRVPNSERYSADKALGQPILANAFEASFNPGEPIEGLIIPSENKASAARILDGYRNLYVRNGKLLDPIVNLGEDNFTGEDRYLGRAVAFRIDRFVIAFNGYGDRQKLIDLAVATDARILGTIRKQLVTAEKEAEAKAEPQPPRNQNAPPWQRP